MDLRFVTKVTDPEYIPYALAGTPSLDLRFASTKSLVDKVSGKNLITFTRASSGTYVGSDGLIKTASTNEPRFDHNSVTGESLGLLVEEQRINRLLHNRDLTQAAWVATNITPTKDQIGADGVSNSASSITSTAGNGTILQTITSASAARATSAFVKRITGSGAIEMTQNGGTTWTAVTVAGDWTRVQIPSATVTNPVVGFRIVASGDAIAVDYAGCEDGAFITSPIATAGATVTRSADVASITGANFASWYQQAEGTVLVEALRGADVDSTIATFSVGAANTGRVQIHSNSESQYRVTYRTGNVEQAVLALASSANNVKIAATIKANDLAAVINSGTPQVSITAALDAYDTLTIGARGDRAIQWNGTIRRLTYWPRRLPNTTLQAITSSTPPTVFGNIKLDNGNSPAAIAGVAPTLDFRPARDRREIESVSLTDKLTFTGGNEGTFVGSDGFIQRAQTNVPRFDHGPVTRRSLGMRLEASGENRLLWSNRFSEWAFQNLTGSGTLGTAATISPNGDSASQVITTGATVGTGDGVLSSRGTTSNNETVTGSVYARAGTAVGQIRLRLRFLGGTTSDGSVFFNINTGVIVSTSANRTATIEPFANGWYRLGVTGTNNATGNTQVELFIYGFDTTAGTYLLSNGQLNPGSLVSYIPTTTAAVTRTADSAVLDGTGVITGTYTMVEKPAGCAVISGTNINLQNGYTVERVMVFPASLTAGQITAIRNVM